MKQQTQRQILVRESVESDLATAKDVFESAFSPLRTIYKPTETAITYQTERFQEGTRLVAEFDSHIVGTVQFANHKKHIHIIGLAVSPDHQRQGIARLFINEIINQALTLGQSILALDTIKETGNVAIFERLGFHVVDEEIATWCVSEHYLQVHDVKMEREIS